VDSFVTRAGGFEAAFRNVEELFGKYRLMENQKISTKAQFKKKLPDVQKTREMVQHLKTQYEAGQSVKTHFNVAAQLYTEAELEKTDKVVIWLGANTALEYTFDEAIALLNKNEERMLAGLKDCDEDLAFLKDQITTLEVSMSRLYNHEVASKRTAGSSSASRS
jgi:prefoldin alpha subunit